MSKNLLSLGIGAVVVLLGVSSYVLWQQSDRGTPTDTPTNTNTNTATNTNTTPPAPKPSEPVRLATLKANDAVSSPLVIKGDAVGTWFFEASFPVRLLDANGTVVAQGIAQAEGEWMTEKYVPFTTTLTFAASKTATGSLVFEKDNPSGLPEHAGSFVLPVTFANVQITTPPSTQEYMTVQVYFANTIKDPNILDCEKSYPTARRVPKTSAVARAAIEELLKGPTAAETKSGFVTGINTGVKIQKLTIVGTIAYIDFDAQFNYQVGGSCRVQMIRSQVENTLKQFSTVKNVVLSVDGQTELILEP